MAFAGESDGEVDGDGGFSDAAFSCAYGDDVFDSGDSCGVCVLRCALGGLLGRLGANFTLGVFTLGGVALEFEGDLSGVVYEVDDES